MKKCTGCKKELPLNKFSSHVRKPDGKNPRCKDCNKITYEKQKEEAEKRKQQAANDPEGAFLNNFMGHIEDKLQNQTYENPLRIFPDKESISS